MPDAAWKAFERRIAKAVGGKRRGADYGDKDGGRNDVIHDTFSVECKLYGRPTWQLLLDATEQAKKAATDTQLPVAVVKKKHQPDAKTLVVMRLGDFQEWFV